jgi:glucose/arabinose dehydrogenase
MTRVWWYLSIIFLGFMSGCASQNAVLEAQAFVQSKLVGGLNSPTAIAVASDGRIFVAYQGGEVRVVKNGALLATPFVTLDVNVFDEQGLIGLALDPQFGSNGYIYLTYTVNNVNPAYQRIVRYTASGDVAVAGSATTLFETNDSPNEIAYHLGGALNFGQDGKLYVTLGEGLQGNEQSLNSFSSKILRINQDGTIPSDNPFYTTATGKFRAIWAKGFRNPYSFAIQATTGRIYVNDVGSGAFEEVNEGVAGANYGFPNSEGSSVNAGETAPRYVYTHNAGRCAIVGGSFYNPDIANFPQHYVGNYFFTDYCTSQIFYIDPANLAAQDAAPVLLTVADIGAVDVDVALDGAMYVLTRGNAASGGGTGGEFLNGSIYKITYTNSQKPTITEHPQSQTVSVGETATFKVVAAGQGLSYQWRKNNINIAGARSATYTTPATMLTDNAAKYKVIIRNAAGAVASQEVSLNVTNNRRPDATILSPVIGSTYRGGLVLNYSGSGTDPDGDTLIYSWKIDLHHDQHVHPVMPATTGSNSGSFTVSRTFHPDETNVFLRLYLTMSDGTFSDTTYIDVLPRKSTFTLATFPAGLQVLLDDQPRSTPLTVESVVGMTRKLGVTSPQNGNTFISWSDGKTVTHSINVLTTPTTYTASFQQGNNTRVVDWYGDYVRDDTAMQRYITLENNVDLDVDGASDDTRGYLPYSTTQSLNPNPSGGNAYGGIYDQDTSYRFYGGVLFQRYNGDFGSRWAEIWERPGADRIYQSADATSDGWAFIFWKKADFLNNGSTQTVRFDAQSKLEVLNYSGADGDVNNNSGRVRFVVQDGNQFYISQNAATKTTPSFTLTNPNIRNWAVYNPSAPYNLKFNATGASFAPHTFSDIRSVGIYHASDNSTSTARRAGFVFERFRVMAVLQP